MTTPGLEPDVQCSNGAVDHSSQNSMAVILKGLNDTLVQRAKASETQTATLTSLKEDILLCTDSNEEAEEEDSNTSNMQLNISAMLNNVLDPSDSGVAKKSACSDSEKQNDVLESLTQAFVQTKDKSPAITEKVAPYTRLCKEDIRPSTKLFGDELSKHLKDMAEAKKAGRQMQRNSDTRTSSHNYLKAGRQKFRRSNFKPYDQTSTGQKTSHPRPCFRVRPGTKECPEKTQPIQQQRLIDNQVRTHFTSFMDGDYLHQN